MQTKVINIKVFNLSLWNDSLRVIMILLLSSLITACQDKQQRQENAPAPEQSVQALVTQNSTQQPEKSPILVTVNGEAITEADIEFIISKTFSSAELMLANDTIKDKILQSLIASRAMKHIMQKNMDSDELQILQQKVAAYEEELYIKAYLQTNAVPEPVTADMVKNWYQTNPQNFGGNTIKHFELLKTVSELSETQRDELLSAINLIRENKNWQKNSQQWQTHYQLVYQQAQAYPGLLNTSLQQALNMLSAGQTSDIILHEGDIYLLRVSRETRTPPRPLAQVSASIRKTLAPVQLKKAVKKASEEAIKQADITYSKHQ